MLNLVCSMAGRSSRFNGTRPKALLTHPNGLSMLANSLVGITDGTNRWDRIVIVALESQVTKEIVSMLKDEIFANNAISCPVEFILLAEETSNQPETIYQAIKQANITGAVYVKDCDNSFRIGHLSPDNGISVSKLGNSKLVAGNKSYIQLDHFGNINNIVEKQVVSDTFSCGGYFFADANEFCERYVKLSNERNLYLSHVIFDMLMDGAIFKPITAYDYLDWGTLDDWISYTQQFRTLFIDLDGVLVKNTGKLTSPSWLDDEVMLEDNIAVLKALDREKTHIVITTSRPEEMRARTQILLSKYEVPFNTLLMGLPHCKRILVNDYARTNPYPSAMAINLERDGNLTGLL